MSEGRPIRWKRGLVVGLICFLAVLLLTVFEPLIRPGFRDALLIFVGFLEGPMLLAVAWIYERYDPLVGFAVFVQLPLVLAYFAGIMVLLDNLQGRKRLATAGIVALLHGVSEVLLVKFFWLPNG